MSSTNNKEGNKINNVLVTRPAHQSAQFVRLLTDCGFSVAQLPCIEIEFKPAELTATLPTTLQSDLIIFTSVNAVIGAHRSLPLPWDSAAEIAAIGSATAQALESLSCSVNMVPATGGSTEALLDVIGEVGNRNITIVRGDSGREALYNTLVNRGAQVRYLCVYVRKTPHYSETEIKTLFADGLPDVTSVTSDLGLTNLLSIIPADLKPSLVSTPLVVNSQRCAELARQEGFIAEIRVADSPGDKAQLAQILSLQ